MATIFAQRGEDFLPLPVLINIASMTNFSNSFLLFELYRTSAALYEAGFIEASPGYQLTSLVSLSLLTTYLADYLESQNLLLADDYLSASLRCLFYLTSPNWYVCSHRPSTSH